MGKPFDPAQAARVRAFFDRLIDPIRETARRLGYAVAVHGSLARDIDLIACPWTDAAVSERELATAIRETIKTHNGGIAIENDHEGAVNPEWFHNGCQPHGKPHGRFTWVFHLGGGPYIDLSVMPRRTDAEVQS